MSTQSVKGTFANRELIIETGRMAKQAHGSVTLQCGGTVVLATVVAGADSSEYRDFFPLTVDYRERTYAAGKIPGGFFKREGRPSEKEILTSRLIDRPIRPLFPEEYKNELQIMVVVVSVDGENATDILAMNAASAALMVSDVPFERPIGAVRVGLLDGQLVANPAFSDIPRSDLDLIIAANEDRIIMIEAGSREISEEKMLEALEFGHREIKNSLRLQIELQKKAGKKKKAIVPNDVPDAVAEKVFSLTAGEFEKTFGKGLKEDRHEAVKQLYKKVAAAFDPKAEGYKEAHIKTAFDWAENKALRASIINKGLRPDGRGFTDIRQITCEVGVLPRTHGSALFTRGQTQSLCVTTLGTGEDEQTIDALEGEQSKSFMLHYNFPPFSVGEVGRNSGPGRREIGHGALAERALAPVIPASDDFPYTVRVVSDILESNGSSSMASVCGGTLSLMDAGVPLKAPVAGIALGLVTEGERWQVLTDIAGAEDHHGDMDFKAAGTREGLTALQMDLKIAGVTVDMLKESFKQAREARFKILDMIEKTIAAPRQQLSDFAPRITTIKINPSKIGELIGPGGKNIRKIVEETGAKIDIQDDGRVSIASTDAKASEEAIRRIQGVAEEPEVGKIYQAKVRKLMNFGAFCEVLPGTDGLCHVSEVSEGFVKAVNDYLRVGDIVPVKVTGIDENGKISLSIKQAKEGGMPMLPPDAERDTISESAPRGGGRDRGSRSRR